MKSITNDSLQSFEIYLKYPTGTKSVFIGPKETIVVPANSITKQCENLNFRKILRIRTV
jgi:hypothetical protein